MTLGGSSHRCRGVCDEDPHVLLARGQNGCDCHREYGFIAAGISVAIIAAVQRLGTKLAANVLAVSSALK
jgi:hypothetical protein